MGVRPCSLPRTKGENIVRYNLTHCCRMDISFPATTLILSDIVPPEYQGVTASMVNTVVNYSVSIGLGIAGTVDSRVNDEGRDVLKGYRAAMWTSVGLSGCAVIVSLSFASWTRWQESVMRKQ